MCLLQPHGYLKRDKQEPLPYWVAVQADLRLCWSHRSYCRCCRAILYDIALPKFPLICSFLSYLLSGKSHRWRNDITRSHVQTLSHRSTLNATQCRKMSYASNEIPAHISLLKGATYFLLKKTHFQKERRNNFSQSYLPWKLIHPR